VRFTSTNKGNLARPELVTRPVSARNPSRALNRSKKLTEAGRMGTNRATGLELDQKRVRFTRARSDLLGNRSSAVEVTDRGAGLRIETQDVHLRSFRKECADA
jgi:hypothetical protein